MKSDKVELVSKGNHCFKNLFFVTYGITIVLGYQILGKFKVGREFGVNAV